MALVLWGLVWASVSLWAAAGKRCADVDLSISGGEFSLSNGTTVGSVVKYSCPTNFYPSPPTRLCRRDGNWFPRPTAFPARCKMVTCPNPLVIQYGSVSPTQRLYYVNNVTHYSCYGGYKHIGSASRTCQPNGKWSGATPICDSSSGKCPDPGVPPGMQRTGSRFGIDDKVTYRCERDLYLLGSNERVCLESGEWSGTEPSCYYKHTYDTPAEAAQAFTASLGNVLEVSGSEQQQGAGPSEKDLGRRIRMIKGGKLNIYIALDASDSVGKKDFEVSKNCIDTLIDKISNFEVTPNYNILSFATDVKEIVNILDDQNDVAIVKHQLKTFQYSSHGDATGTNIREAFNSIYNKMNFLKAQDEKKFKDIRHVIILFTDGRANMGGNPVEVVRKIKELVYALREENKEDYLDMYVFGVGSEIEPDEINDLVSHKPREKHFFVMQDVTNLDKLFDDIIDEGENVGLCGLYRTYKDEAMDTTKTKRQNYPWLVTIKITRSPTSESCLGSLLSSRFVLTAAHCFKPDDEMHQVKVLVDDSVETSNKMEKEIKSLHIHPDYNIGLKKDEGIPEFYDYDVALIELEKDVIMSRQARPICIPCTKGASRALRLFGKVTCADHEAMLLDKDEVSANFMSPESQGDRDEILSRNVIIKLGGKRDSCVRDALQAEGITATDPYKVVTERFLCTGGTEPTRDDMTCKGDSGGAVFMSRKSRLFQVGVISWGNTNLCPTSHSREEATSTSRDYHISLFKVQDFLKKHLAKDAADLPGRLEFID
ncbi:complement factor B-like [Lepisosteus oculatus]|uniref:complement factor B-like n=1 Tax=Lepisosteus oculatus TaxID=7918 RepID=UPI0035F51F62